MMCSGSKLVYQRYSPFWFNIQKAHDFAFMVLPSWNVDSWDHLRNWKITLLSTTNQLKKNKDLIGIARLRSPNDHRCARLSSTGTKAESFKCDSFSCRRKILGVVGYRGIKSPAIQGVCETKISVLHPHKSMPFHVLRYCKLSERF
jgi:hypothetical protein